MLRLVLRGMTWQVQRNRNSLGGKLPREPQDLAGPAIGRLGESERASESAGMELKLTLTPVGCGLRGLQLRLPSPCETALDSLSLECSVGFPLLTGYRLPPG